MQIVFLQLLKALLILLQEYFQSKSYLKLTNVHVLQHSHQV